MSNFLTSILKRKKAIILILLFFIGIEIIIPQTTRATTCVSDGTILGMLSPSTYFGCIDTALAMGADEAAVQLFTAVARGITVVLLNGSSSIASFASSAFSAIFSGLLDWKITTYGPFLVGWTAVRDLTNMLIVLGFVLVGIAFTLRLESYGSKKILINLVLITLLINFSGVFCGLIIDGSKIAMDCFVNGKCTSGSNVGSAANANIGQTNILTSIADFTEKNLGQENIQNETMMYIGAAFLSIAMYVIVIIVFGYMSIVMLERYVRLGILFVVSPLAFFAWIFPATSKYWNRWWEEFLKWAFIGVEAGFFLWIAQKIITSTPSKGAGGSSSANFGYLIVSLAFLFIGFKTISKSSAFANSVMGMAKTAVGVATGATMAVATGGASMAAGGLLNQIRTSRAGQATGNAVGRGLEFLRLRKEGTTAQNAAKQMEEKQKLVGNLAEERKTTLATGSAWTSEGVSKKVAAIQNKVEKGNLNDLGDTEKQRQSIAYVESYQKSRGVNSTIRRDAIKSNPNLAGNPTEIATAVRKIAPTKAAEWNEDVATPDVALNLSAAQIKEIGNKGSPELVNKVKNYKITTNPSGVAVLDQQSAEVKNLFNQITSLPMGSPERAAARKRIAELQKKLANNNNFA